MTPQQRIIHQAILNAYTKSQAQAASELAMQEQEAASNDVLSDTHAVPMAAVERYVCANALCTMAIVRNDRLAGTSY